MRPLSWLLQPRTLAVIGGGAWCDAVIRQARGFGFAGDIWPVHPTADTVGGLPAMSRIEDLPNAPDAAFVGINRRATIAAVAALSKIGAGGAVCFASGFAEAAQEDREGRGLEAELLRAAGDMPVLGPNCYGFVNGLDRVAVWPDQHGMAPVERGVAILTQSSNIAINLTMQRRALPLAFAITCGNQAQTSQADLALALLDDARITAIGLHIEGFGDPNAWIAVAETARDRNVPIVALKVGASSQARAATVTHTSSLAGEDAGAQALLDRLGIARVADLPSFLETLKLFHVVGKVTGKSIASISCSGGEASLIADMAAARGIDMPPLTDPQRQRLRATLGPMVALANPLDYHTYIWRDAETMAQAWSAMTEADVGITLSIVDYPHTDHTDWACATDAALRVARATHRPFAMAATLPELMPEDIAGQLMNGGVVPFCGLAEALTAIACASGMQNPNLEPVAVPTPVEATRTVTETEAKSALAEFDLPVPRSKTVARGGAWDKSGLQGPLAVKGMGVAHKSEAGLVRLNVDPAEVPDVIAEMDAQEFLIEEMVTDGVAELLVGVIRDPAHGFVLTLAAGGVMTELLSDSRSLLIPARDDDILGAMDQLTIAPLLRGFRGKPAANMTAILFAVRSVQDYVIANAEILVEVEINPLICTPTRAAAVDALIRKA
ncbi:MAG: acetate--CoA ligase family protein [Pseudomonadota bacterium]